MIIALLVLILLAILFPGFMRAVFLGLIAAFMLALVLAPAHAGDGLVDGPPEYDVERNCTLLFKEHAGYYNQCIARDERNYRILASIWGNIPEEVQDYCVSLTDRLVRMEGGHVGGIYSGVIDCVVHQKAKYDSEHPNQPKRRFSP